MSEYPAIPRYYVYEIISVPAMGGSHNGLEKKEYKGFDEEEQAVEWIQIYGERQTVYTIVKEFRKV